MNKENSRDFDITLEAVQDFLEKEPDTQRVYLEELANIEQMEDDEEIKTIMGKIRDKLFGDFGIIT